MNLPGDPETSDVSTWLVAASALVTAKEELLWLEGTNGLAVKYLSKADPIIKLITANVPDK